MTEAIGNFGELASQKETAYQNISSLYENWDVQFIRVDYVAERKTVLFSDGWLFINKETSHNVVSFLVNMNGKFLYRISQDTRDLNHIMVNSSTAMELGGFKQEVSTSEETWQTIPEEHRDNVFGVLIDWTMNSIKEGKITEPPYNLAVT